MTHLALPSNMPPSGYFPPPPLPPLPNDNDLSAMEARSSSSGANGNPHGQYASKSTGVDVGPSEGIWNPWDKSWIPGVPQDKIGFNPLDPFGKFTTTTPAPRASSSFFSGFSGDGSLMYWWFNFLLAVYVLCTVGIVLLTVELFKMFNTNIILANRTSYLASRRKIQLNDYTPSEQREFSNLRLSPNKPG